MVRAWDQAGNKLPFLVEPVEISIEGPARRIGPALVPLRRGSTGFRLESIGGRRAITATITSPRLGIAKLELAAE